MASNGTPSGGHRLELSHRQLTEAAVYDDRVRATVAQVPDEDLRVDPQRPPYPNREHVDFLSFALSQAPSLSGASVLEVGSGSGMLSVYLALNGAVVTGIDVSQENVKLASRRALANDVAGRTRFVDVPIENFGEPDASYDFIIGNQVLHHFELEQALPNIVRLLKPGGCAVFCEPVMLLPDVFRRLRNSPTVTRVAPRRVDTPTERSLSPRDLALMCRIFPNLEFHPFQLFARLQNFMDVDDRWFARLVTVDRWLLEHVSALRRVCRFAVLIVRPGAGREFDGSFA